MAAFNAESFVLKIAIISVSEKLSLDELTRQKVQYLSVMFASNGDATAKETTVRRIHKDRYVGRFPRYPSPLYLR